MAQTPVYIGIDLGTTNSAAALFDGSAITMVRNVDGGALTPSVVRMDGRGTVTVGTRARRLLENDPNNTRAEFKRLMGTETKIDFLAAKTSKKPEELSAEILKSIRMDIQDQCGFAPEKAVISVPALFELPQSAATTTAAKLAGFTQVELIQEPVASALAAGWSAAESRGPWLVYDLGGGTFDVSLLRTQEGRLIVVGHDGDNFLGGRDFDWTLVDWILGQINSQNGIQLSRSDAQYASAFRKLKYMAEEAKIELSRQPEVSLTLPSWLVHDGNPIDVDLVLDRTTAEMLFRPLIQRSIEVCQRLCTANHVDLGFLEKIVFVGGPTLTPGLRQQVVEALRSTVALGADPMTLVAQGAALYAASIGLEARAAKAEPQTSAHKLWLQYPAMSSDLTPHVIGRVIQTDSAQPLPESIRLIRGDGLWESPTMALGPDGGFVTNAMLVARHPNVFVFEAKSALGEPISVSPSSITIVQGMSLNDPPLSRTIGVALASDVVQVYFEKGTPLPARKSFVHKTVEAISKNTNSQFALKIPIVQGEYEQAHLCRLVGSLEIPSKDILDSLPSGSDVEITLSLDRSGQLTASALVKKLSQVFQEVAHLVVPDAPISSLKDSLSSIIERLNQAKQMAFRQNDKALIEQLGSMDMRMDGIKKGIAAAEGGDEDAGQKARRDTLEMDALLEQIEATRHWPELLTEAHECLARASHRVSSYGTPHEKNMLVTAGDAIQIAMNNKQPAELQRQLRIVRKLHSAAYFRMPGVWEYEFEAAVAAVTNGEHALTAKETIRQGMLAIEKNDLSALQQAVHKLWSWLPVDAQDRRLGFESGIR